MNCLNCNKDMSDLIKCDFEEWYFTCDECGCEMELEYYESWDDEAEIEHIEWYLMYK